MPDTPKRALRRLATALRHVQAADVALDQAVADARSAGASWAAIGEVLGMSKQSAHERFGP